MSDFLDLANLKSMDELLGARVPQSMQAEQAVIGSMLIDPRCIADVVSAVRTADFFNFQLFCILPQNNGTTDFYDVTGIEFSVYGTGVIP